MKILHIEPLRYSDSLKQLIQTAGEVDFCQIESQEELLVQIGRKPYEAIFVKLGIAIDARVMEAAPFLKFVITPTTGLDHIDTEAASAKGIQVLSLRGEEEFLRSIRSTAEHTWGLVLSLLRRIHLAHADVLAGHWRREPFLGAELNGKVLGVIGYGRLGRIVAQIGCAFQMTVLVHDTDPRKLIDIPDSHIQPTDLRALLKKSDVLTLHIPSNPLNHRYLDEAKIMLMKKGAVLINTARGEVVDEKALLRALESKHLSGAALDVVDGDSSWDNGIPLDHPLLTFASQHDNLLLTPHIGGYAREAIENTRAFMVRKFIRQTQFS